MDRAPQAYEATYESHEPAINESAFNVGYVKSASGILKLCEMVISIIVFICVASAQYWPSHHSGGYCNFVAAFSLCICALFFIFYFFNLIRKFPGYWIFIEFFSYIFCIFFWVFAIIAAGANTGFGGGAIATAVFSVIAVVVFIVECATRFRVSCANRTFRVTLSAVRTVTPPYPNPVMTSTVPAPPPTTTGYPGTYSPEATDGGYVMP